MNHRNRHHRSSLHSRSEWSSSGWSPTQWRGYDFTQNRINFGAIFDQRRADAKDGAKEQSFLCPGFRVPPYISWRLPASARAELSTHAIGPSGRIDTEFDRPVRIFFENGLEVRIMPGDALELRAIYHVHPWHIGRKPDSRSKGPIPRDVFDSREETLCSSSYTWAKVVDPLLSAHAQLSALARRKAATKSLASAVHIDASHTRELTIVTTEMALQISRPKGTGLTWASVRIGRDRFDRLDPPASSTLSSMHDALMLNPRLRAAAQMVDRCHAALPLPRRISLEMAAYAALVGCAYAELFRPLQHALKGTLVRLKAAFRASEAVSRDPHPEHAKKDTT